MYSLSYAIMYPLSLMYLSSTESIYGILGRRGGRGASPQKSFSEVITQCRLSSVSITYSPVFPSDWKTLDFSERKISLVSLKQQGCSSLRGITPRTDMTLTASLTVEKGLNLSWKLQGVPPLPKKTERAQTATRDRRWNPKVKNFPHCWAQAPHSKDHHAGPSASAHSWV